MRKLIKLLFTLLTSFSLVSCRLFTDGNTPSNSSEVEITKIAFLQNTYSVVINKEVNVKYTLTPTSANKKDIIFENLNPEIFEIIDDTKGTIKGISIGKGTLKVKTPQNIEATCEIVVTDDYDKNLDENHVHEFSDKFVLVKPTCVKDGSKTYKCKYTRCNETKVEVLPKKGHTPSTNKEKAEDLLANVSDGINKKRYYYRCTTCHKAADDSEPYEVGYGDILARSIRSTYDKTTADSLINTMQNGIDAVKDNYDKDFEERFFNNTISNYQYYYRYKPFGKLKKDEYTSIGAYVTYALPIEGIGLLSYGYTSTSDNNLEYLRCNLEIGYDKYSARQADAHYLDDIIEKARTEKNININQSEKERVYKIYNFVIEYLSFGYYEGTTDYGNTCILTNIKTKKATFGGYTKLFNLLCKAFHIDSITILGYDSEERHAWNAVCINGKWYFLDATWGDSDELATRKEYFLRSRSDFYTTSNNRKPDEILDIKLDLGATSLSYSAT